MKKEVAAHLLLWILVNPKSALAAQLSETEEFKSQADTPQFLTLVFELYRRCLISALSWLQTQDTACITVEVSHPDTSLVTGEK